MSRDYGLVSLSTMGDIADAIREKTGETDTIKPVEMATQIRSITTGSPDAVTYTQQSGRTAEEKATARGNIDAGTYSGGTTPSGTISITNNGTVDVSAYASANVNVSAATAFGAHNGWKIAKFVTVASEVGNGATASIDIGVSNATQIMLICMSVSSRSVWGMQVAHFTPTAYATAGVLSLKPSTGQTYGSSSGYIGSVSYSGSTLNFTVTSANGTVRAGEYLVLYQ